MYINAGFDDYLTKPIDTGRLESMLLTYLPPDLVEKAEEDAEEEKKPETKRSILAVDSDIAFLKKIKEWLSDQYNVVVVKTGEQALAYLEKHEADIILLDYDSPLQSKFEESKILRSHFKEISRDEIASQVNDFLDK
jgi:PleD family two-component response regulator